MDIGTDACPYRYLSLKGKPIISEIFQKFSDFFLKLSELFQKNSDIFLYIPAFAAPHFPIVHLSLTTPQAGLSKTMRTSKETS